MYFLLEGTSSLNVRVLAAVVAGAKTKVGPADPHRHGEGTFNTKVSLTSARPFLDLWLEPVEISFLWLCFGILPLLFGSKSALQFREFIHEVGRVGVGKVSQRKHSEVQ